MDETLQRNQTGTGTFPPLCDSERWGREPLQFAGVTSANIHDGPDQQEKVSHK